VKELKLETLIEIITAETGCECEAYPDITHDETILIPADQLQAVIAVLREHFGIFHLSTITAQERESQSDEPEPTRTIELIYHFWHGKGVSLLVRLPFTLGSAQDPARMADAPKIDSICALIPGADFYEREVAEMYGVIFTGRAETPKLLLPEEWDQGPPFIRKEETDE
jgi:NADH-quinone oxidoreductase subunit C